MRKFKNRKGFTLIEMLACTVTLLLIALICTTGTNLAVNSYEESVLESNIQNLQSTVDMYVGDILRYAEPTGFEGDGTTVKTLTNMSYQIRNGNIKISEDGYLVCTSERYDDNETLLVGENAYAGMLYIADFELKYDDSTKLFEGKYVIGNTLNDSLRICEFAYRTNMK